MSATAVGGPALRWELREGTGEILDKRLLAPGIHRYAVRAPEIAKARQAGQFVIVRPRPDAERIPLTIAGGDEDSIILIVQEVGKTTAMMADMTAGESLTDLCGPLGRPTHIEKLGSVAVVAGGIGAAPALPIAAALRRAGNRVTAILGARSRELLILEHELRSVSDRLVITTDDGSVGLRGFVTTALEQLIEADPGLAQVFAVGPALMMQKVCEVTRPRRIPTVVSLNTIMIDGTGMCGGCRASVGGQTRFVCVDGPEFDGHEVDFALMIRRQAMYAGQERMVYQAYQEQRRCRLQRHAAAGSLA